jgi:hypothetical protein
LVIPAAWTKASCPVLCLASLAGEPRCPDCCEQLVTYFKIPFGQVEFAKLLYGSGNLINARLLHHSNRFSCQLGDAVDIKTLINFIIFDALHIPVNILWRAFSLFFNYTRVAPFAFCRRIYGQKPYFMPPVIAEIEPVEKKASLLYFQGGNGREGCIIFIRLASELIIHDDAITDAFSVHRLLAAELELVHMMIKSVKGFEDGPMQVVKCLRTPDVYDP